MRTKVWAKASDKPTRSVAKCPQRVHTYGGLCYKGTLGLYQVIGTTGLKSKYALTGSIRPGVDSSEYGNVLLHEFIPECRRLYRNQAWTFMQDGATCHTSKGNKKLLLELGVDCLEWPPNSPDLNPIENAWAIVSREMERKGF